MDDCAVMIDFDEACGALCVLCRGGITAHRKEAVSVHNVMVLSTWSHWVEYVEPTANNPHPPLKESTSYVTGVVYTCNASRLRDKYQTEPTP